MTKWIPPIKKQTLNKKAQEKNDKIKRELHTDNSNWNDCRFQLHWNKLDWVNTRSKIVRKTLFKFFKKKRKKLKNGSLGWKFTTKIIRLQQFKKRKLLLRIWKLI